MNLFVEIRDNKRISSLLINSAKILIIIFMGIFLLGFFNPFYEYPNNAKIYGYQAMVIANGGYEYQNELLEKTGYWEFVPAALVKTQFNTGIPNILPLYPAIGAIFYKILGLSGLFYLNPIITILFLIVTERITTKIFDRKVGLFVIVFLATNEMTFWVGSALLTSSLFSLFFIIGIYFIVKYFKTNSYSAIILMSTFFTLAAFVRPNGMIFVPIAIGTIIAYHSIKIYLRKDEKKSKKIIKKIILGIVPWLVFVVFMFMFNQYFFGDPITTFYNVPGLPQDLLSQQDDAFAINPERLERYSGHFLPFPLDRIASALNYGETSANQEFENMINSFNEIPYLSHIGLFSLLLIGLSLFNSFKTKKMRTESSVYAIFIIGIIMFYSINYIAIGRQGAARDMMPVFPLFYALLGNLLIKILEKNEFKGSMRIKIPTYLGKVTIMIFLIILVPTSFYFADYSQIIKKEGFTMKNPLIYAENFPTITDPTTENDIIMTIFEFDIAARNNISIFTPYSHFDPEDPLHIQMMLKLNDLLQNDNINMLVFKNPHDFREKKFHLELVNSNKYILTDHSKQFCKLELKNDKQRISDQVCTKTT